jgi:putative dimethyl sulfoxide reductase chaperone
MSDHDRERDAARADLCRFLAACYYEPGPEFAEEKVFTSMQQAASRIDPELAAGARRLGEAFAATDAQDLLIDYTRLFLGPVDTLAQPYGSVWLGVDQGLMQDSTMAVLALYAEGGFDVDESFRDLPDHVAAELEFLYLLIFRECAAQLDDDAAALVRWTELRRRFLAEHLALWVGPFATAIRAGAQTAFYRELALLTERFVRMEAGSGGAD